MGGIGSGRTPIHGESTTRLYLIWQDMVRRCHQATNNSYYLYGAKGISVCDEWRTSYITFRDWARGSGYNDTLTIDRKNPRGNYEPSNCRWATQRQQAWNRRQARRKHTPFVGILSISPGRWQARIRENNRTVQIGTFATQIEAALAYDKAAFELRGEFARLNFPERIPILISRKEGATC